MSTCSGRQDVPCGYEATESDGRCVFHSEVEGKATEPFERAIEEVRQGGEANWSGWVIPIVCNFEDVSFTKNADFGDTMFRKNANFRDATFTKYADFWRATFAQAARFSNATFAQDADFRSATFAQDVYFRRATFTQDVDFERATFRQFADFESATFIQTVSFGIATFTQRAYFSSATFTQDAFFTGVTFTEDATFSGATFAQDATFTEATFAQDAYFIRTLFKRSVQFTAATFKRRGTLEDCKFTDRSSFDSTDVSRITFRRCELSGAVFANSHNLHEATFDRCTWGKLSHPVVWEETQARAAPTPGVTAEKGPRDWFGEAEVVYREVRWSLESRKNFQKADKFAVREMEMRRLAYLGTPDSPWYQRFWGEIRANFLSVPGAYHLFGNYGQSISRPTVGMLILVFVLGPVLLIWTDTMAFPGYSEAVLRMLRIVALLPDLPSPQGSLPTPEGWRQVAEVFFRLAGPFFALLFALAVRRRVRR